MEFGSKDITNKYLDKFYKYCIEILIQNCDRSSDSLSIDYFENIMA